MTPATKADLGLEGKKIANGPADKGDTWAGASGTVYKVGAAGYKYKNCTHWRTRFELPNGMPIYASAWRDEPKMLMERTGPRPTLGFYMDNLWIRDGLFMVSPGLASPIPKKIQQGYADNVVFFDWDDFGTPDSIRQFHLITQWLLKYIEAGQMVEVGCIGGHGRTGTLLACMMVLLGADANVAIAHVRDTYCWEAIETNNQYLWVLKYENVVNGRPPMHGLTGGIQDPTWLAGYDKYTFGGETAFDNALSEDAAAALASSTPAQRAEASIDSMMKAQEKKIEDDDAYRHWLNENARILAELQLDEEDTKGAWYDDLAYMNSMEDDELKVALDELCCESDCINPYVCGGELECWRSTVRMAVAAQDQAEHEKRKAF